MHQVSSFTVLFFVGYMHTHVPFITYCSMLFVVVFQEMNCLHIFEHDICSSGHRDPSLYQVSCLSILWLVRYTS